MLSTVDCTVSVCGLWFVWQSIGAKLFRVVFGNELRQCLYSLTGEFQDN